MKKKKILVVIALILITLIGTTIAYFNTTADFENRFNLGNYNILIQEVFESPDDWAPGETIPKTITAKNEGNVETAVRISYEEKWTDQNNNIVTNVPAGTAIINFTTPSNWTKVGDYYYYNYYLKANQETTSLIESVTLNPNLNNATCTEENGSKTCTSNVQGLGGYHYTLTFTIETVQADKYKSIWNTNIEIIEKPSVISYISRQVEGQITPGDVIGIGETEDFYVISSNPEKTVLLAKYNLLVGEWEDSLMTPATTAGYGLQSVDAIGYGAGPGYATMLFSNTNYWNGENNTLLSPYNANGASYDGNPYPYVYNSSLNTKPDFTDSCDGLTNCFETPGYSIAFYIEQYKTTLIEMGAPRTIIGRLLTYEEAEESTFASDTSQSYWLGSAYSDYGVWTMYSGGIRSNYSYNEDDRFGVRPVIEIPTSEIN